MAVSANTVWEFQTAGSSDNGGGFVTGASGTDFSYPTSAPVHITGVIGDGTSTCLHGLAAASWVGNIVNVISGTNFTSTAGVSRFEITSVNVGVSFTVSTNKAGTAISTGIGIDGDMYVGGAVNFYNSASDDGLMECSSDGNFVYIKLGSYTCGTVSLSDSGTVTARHNVIGYNSTRGDNPISTTRPTITLSGTWTSATGWGYRSLMYTGSLATTVFACASTSHIQIKSCKFTNTSATSTDAACTAGSNGFFDDCEFVNNSGIGLSLTFQMHVRGCRFNACNQGLVTTAGYNVIEDNIFSGCVTESIRASAVGYVGSITNNTLYGASSPAGIGIQLVTAQGAVIMNNIISGFVTGITHDTASQLTCIEDFNDFFNNTTNRTNISVGANSVTTNPTFTSAGTGDFTPGANMKALAFPKLFPGGLVTSYKDLGAIQRQGGTSTDPGITNVISTAGTYLIDDVLKTPTYIANIASDVRIGTLFGPSSSIVGTLVPVSPVIRKTSSSSSGIARKTSSVA